MLSKFTSIFISIVKLFGIWNIVVTDAFVLNDLFHLGSHAHTSDTSNCYKLSQYNVLKNIRTNSPCTSDTEVWKYLEELRAASVDCLKDVVKTLSDSPNNKNAGCSCSGDFEKPTVNSVGGNHDHYTSCYYDTNCRYFLTYFYQELFKQEHQRSPCQTHEHIWVHLRGIHAQLGVDPFAEIVQHLGDSFKGSAGSQCTCSNAALFTKQPTTHVPTPRPTTIAPSPSPTTIAPTQSPSTETPTQRPITQVVTQTNAPTTMMPTTTQPVVLKTCQKFGSVLDIADKHQRTHPQSSICPSGNRSASEAYLLCNCDVGPPITWQRGVKVMTDCESIPLYTPIAAFNFPDAKGWSGIFVGCLPVGFKIAFQTCDSAPVIQHVEKGNGPGVQDPFTYYAIQ